MVHGSPLDHHDSHWHASAGGQAARRTLNLNLQTRQLTGPPLTLAKLEIIASKVEEGFKAPCSYGPIPRFEFPSVKERGIFVQGKTESQESVVQINFYAKELAQYDQLLYCQDCYQS
jgi:hypothetical protein